MARYIPFTRGMLSTSHQDQRLNSTCSTPGIHTTYQGESPQSSRACQIETSVIVKKAISRGTLFLTMAGKDASQQELLSHLAHRPRHIIDGVISVNESVTLSFPKIDRDCQSSLGRLDVLPIELLLITFNYLDLQSLSRISRVSLHANKAVQSLPTYRDLLSITGHVFQVLSLTRVISLHSVGTLHATLLSDQCVSCGNYGPFLFLISADRSCFACLSRNRSLWMTPLSVVDCCSNLTQRDLKTLPTMRSIPGQYSVESTIPSHRPIRLTSVRAAKELALKKYGSDEALARNLEAKNLDRTKIQYYQLRWFHDAPLELFENEHLSLQDLSNTPNHIFCGMGAIPFPSMSRNGVENGLWCRGCEWTHQHFGRQRLNDAVMSRVAPPGYDTWRFLLEMQHRAYSVADFLKHARYCYSAREVIASRWTGWK